MWNHHAWTPLHERHVVELIMLNSLLLLPLVYLAFTFAAMAFRARAAGATLRDGRVLATTLLTGALYGCAIVVSWSITGPFTTPGLSLWMLLHDEPMRLAGPFLSAMLIASIAGTRARSWAMAGCMLFYVLVTEAVPSRPGFAALDGMDRAHVLLAVALAVGLSVVAAANMATPSLVGRAAAVLCSVWATALVAFAIVATGARQDAVLHPSQGVLTPQLLEGVTLFVVACAVLTAAETRRLVKLQRDERKLSKSERRMRMLADAAHEGLVILRDGVVIDTNRTFKTLVGEPLDPDAFEPCRLGFYFHDKTVPANGEAWLRHRGGAAIAVELNEARLDDDRRVLSVRDVTQAKRDAQRIRELASNDALTGLANRGTFDRALAEPRPVGPDDATLWAVLMIDLDRFKPVNDTYGHAAGDQMLAALARRFEAVLRRNHAERPNDILARIGGDEFAVLVEVSDVEAARRLGQRLCAAAGGPVPLEHAADDGPRGEVMLKAGASVGVSVCDSADKGLDTCHADILRKRADLALYAAKDQGRGCVVIYDDAMGARAERRLSVEADLRTALERGEIALHYQMQQDLKSGSVVGYEALMRWQHPVHGNIRPDEFIPLAEELGVIVQLGAWALERAARDFSQLDDRTRVSVNVSPRQFVSGDLAEDVARALARSGLAAERLELEITESVLIEDAEGTLAVLDRLREMGVSLSLDDFGSGYSSLAYLTRFPFSKLKIDRQFISRMGADPRSLALVRSILAMAGSLDMRVTAEGVETNAQLMALVTGHCDEAQGFLLGRPCDFETTRRRHADLAPVRGKGDGPASAKKAVGS